VPTTVLCLAVGFFALFGLPIPSLGLAMIFAPAIQTAGGATIDLAPKAATANAEKNIAPPASALQR
jgi:hypothetical protein